MRLFHTVRYLRLRQIVARLRYTPRRLRRFRGKGKRLDNLRAHYFEGPFTLEDVHAWIATHHEKAGEAWDPYTISVRVPKWLEYDDPIVQRSVHDQLAYLAKNIEHDIGGNHVIKNLRALILGGMDMRNQLRREVKEQILPDGGHFERTPTYHVEVLNDLRDISAVIDEPWLRDAIERMQHFLDAITLPDGTLPLLKDTVLTEPRATDNGQRTTLFKDTGFAIVRTRDAYTIADFGPPGPDYLLAHAHADALSFELAIDGRRTIVDSGVFEYEAGEWRDYFRSTRAHNTVEVAGENQSEVWSSFRVARRARVKLVRFEETADAITLVAEHDGYARLHPAVIHRRTFAWPREGPLLIVTDELLGRGTTTAVSRLHLHPDAMRPNITTFGFDDVREETGWYAEQFNEKRENVVIAMRKAGALPMKFGYTIARD